MKKITIIQILTLLAIMLVPMLLLAQPASSPYGSGISSDSDAAPIDGGLSLLVAAGVGYGAKKMKEKRQKGKEA
jgi:hypothetical protein